MKIPFVDLGPQTRAVREQAMRAWGEILDRGAFSGGEAVERFEKAWSAYLGVPHAIGCSDGTTAIVLALRALGIGAGDEVICPPTSFFATAEAIALVGATPTFADVDYATGNFDPAKVAAAVAPKTRAIAAVHLTGRPAPMDELRAIADRHKLKLIEDSAQAQGAEHKGVRIGGLGDVASFSFYPTKNLGALGEAGGVVTRDADLASKVRALRDHGQTSRHVHAHVGYNARLHPMQAVVLEQKIGLLDTWNDERRVLAQLYRKELEAADIEVPLDPPNAKHVYHLFTVRTPKRDALMAHLSGQGIGTGLHYPTPIHLQPAFAYLGYAPGAFPQSEAYARNQLSLPMYPGLGEDNVRAVAKAIREFLPR